VSALFIGISDKHFSIKNNNHYKMPRWDEPTGPEDSHEVLEYMGMHPELCPDAIGVSAHQLLDPAFPRE
jgi:hypothetical protein